MKQRIKTFLLWVVLVAACVIIYQYFGDKKSYQPIDFQAFLTMVKDGRVDNVRIDKDQIMFQLYDSQNDYVTRGEMNEDFFVMLHENEVTLTWEEPSFLSSFMTSENLTTVIIVLIFLILVIYFLKKAGGGTANILSLRKTTARRIKDKTITFDNVGGCKKAKALLVDMVDFLKDPKPWTAAGARLPRGILLEGPTGCGKTLLARAVAGETNAAFFHLAASEFVEMFVGVGAARVRDLFEKAAKSMPAVIFIDEMDAVGRRRGSGLGSAHDEREQTLNQLLVCMDGFEKNDRLVVIGATNRPDILDKALLRPGRFDGRVRVPHLSKEDRLEILKIHTRNKPMGDGIDFEILADRTDGLNGADIENLSNEAALLAVRRTRSEKGLSPQLTMIDFEKALDPVGTGKQVFNALDALLIESVTQLSEPVGKIVARISFKPDHFIQGEIIWADAVHIKIKDHETGKELIVPKAKIRQIEAAKGTEMIARGDVSPDHWTRPPDMA